ncbi:archaeosine biosynthesis radical SAM protein RaSEA [Oceanirhabdus sp. W0125-5]|uniref:archaeosine biosynthesis radical SAM protein RaSEA n=1 Tax=Oceanirhabdus sp. W0125-5 TaxID=2999116 RepID=UPI0022F345E3|nr:archaeosine biosynthesis radical SAM protein RaSEA [Oceanirhabdus sp. W0125-5]WBW96390.1 archaeosine biosynthesis radical SAM protein RaSEA [Oceanirhabdus sp. W0125-5]
MSFNTAFYKDVRDDVSAYMKQLREFSKMESSKKMDLNNKVLFTEMRRGMFNNEYIDRLVLFLKGTGCVLATETGGCTFCGFYNATNFGVKIPDNDYIEQVKNVLNDKEIDFSSIPVVCFYNDGSLLREEEISFKTLLKIISIINEKDSIKKITLEARIEDITEDKLSEIKKVTNKEIEIAVGFESANPIIRDLCINKSFENRIFEEKCKLAKKYGISIVPLLLLKPPFLTEHEAIEDYINSLEYLEKFNLKRIDMELLTVEKFTMVFDLWQKKMFNPPKLWSVIEVLKKREEKGLKTPLYISPASYSVPAEAKTSNCHKCDDSINRAIENYNKSGDISILKDIECSCKKEWIDLKTQENLNENLLERINQILKQLKAK